MKSFLFFVSHLTNFNAEKMLPQKYRLMNELTILIFFLCFSKKNVLI